MTAPFIHPSAEVSGTAHVGEDTQIWNQAQVRAGASIGRGCIIAKGVYIDSGVQIGDHVKVQNRVSIYRGVTIEAGVFVGPHVSFTNDKYPRAITIDGRLKGESDWQVVPTLVRYGASLGAGAVILPGVVIGRWAMVAAGSVVTRDVPDHGMVVGNPARLMGYVCRCGRPLQHKGETGREDSACLSCKETYALSAYLLPEEKPTTLGKGLSGGR